MSAAELFRHWREIKRPEHSWGLAWFLANEFCRRYYSSHGIVPWVIDHDGLGYYGIELNQLRCGKVKGEREAYGRLTIGGDVENWRIGSPGDHGLASMEMCSSAVPTEEIVRRAISHMGLKAIPSVSHLNCRHKRWGKSYELCFEIATILALRNEPQDLQIWNHPVHTERAVAERDPESEMKEHLGAFLFVQSENTVLLAGDGRLLDGSGRNLWESYMKGHGVTYLADLIEGRLRG